MRQGRASALSHKHESVFSAAVAEYLQDIRESCETGKRMKKTAVRVVELFAGVGGFRVGLEQVSTRFKTVWNNQWEPATKRQDASVVYCSRFGAYGHSNVDIATVNAREIPKCDLLVGGFPCQDYSVATTLKNAAGIEGKKGVLWWEICRILREAGEKPKYLLLENVDRLLKSPATQRGRDFAIILASLSDLGYRAEWRVINAADYGMPQRRRRTYIVAYLAGSKASKHLDAVLHECGDGFKWIQSEGLLGRAFPCSFSEKKLCRTAFEISGSLVQVSSAFNKGKGRGASPFHSAGVMSDRKVWTADVDALYTGKRVTLGDILVPEGDVPADFFIPEAELEQWKYLKGSKAEIRTSANGFKYRYSEGAMTFPDSPDKPSRTVITGEGGKSPSRFKHVVKTPSGRYRRLIPLELERLNMFPDNHTLAVGVSDISRAFLMGNALVTGIVARIGKELLARM